MGSRNLAADAFVVYSGIMGTVMTLIILALAVFGVYKLIQAITPVRRDVSEHIDSSIVDDDDTDVVAFLEMECADLAPLVRMLGKKPLAREEP